MATNHLVRAAAESGDLATVRARVDAGDDLESRHKGTGRTPLGWAVVQGHAEIARVPLAHTARVDGVAAHSFLARTPLHLAAQTGDVECIRVLLGAGADVTLVDGRGDNALTLAREGGNAEAVMVLEAAGAVESPRAPEPEPLPWPSLGWDPTALDTLAALPDDAEPAQVVSSYIRALQTWEIETWRLNSAAREQGEYLDLAPALDAAERLTAAHATPRVRKHRRASVGAIPDLTDEFVLVEIAAPATSRRELLVRHPNPTEFVHEYEWVFVCLRRKGVWRIDSARNRLRGTSE